MPNDTTPVTAAQALARGEAIIANWYARKTPPEPSGLELAIRDLTAAVRELTAQMAAPRGVCGARHDESGAMCEGAPGHQPGACHWNIQAGVRWVDVDPQPEDETYAERAARTDTWPQYPTAPGHVCGAPVTRWQADERLALGADVRTTCVITAPPP